MSTNHNICIVLIYICIYIFIPHIQFLFVNYKSIKLDKMKDFRGYINRAENVQPLPIMHKALGLIWSTKNYIT